MKDYRISSNGCYPNIGPVIYLVSKIGSIDKII